MMNCPTDVESPQPSHRAVVRPGFTLTEILIVVAIMGILGAILVPRFNNSTDGARVNGVVKNFRAFETAIDVYGVKSNGSMPSSNSELQTAIEEYLPPGSTSETPSIGGSYGFHSFSSTDSAAIAIWGSTYPNLLVEIDSMLDDGNLDTGRVRGGPNDGIVYFVFGDIPDSLPW